MTAPLLHLVPGFVADPDNLFHWLLEQVDWDERMKARKTASFGVAYNYSQITYDAAPMPAPLAALCDALEGELGFRPNNCLINFYADGHASMGFHSDDTQVLVPGTGVAIVSLGSARPIVYRSKVSREQEVHYLLENGSLLYMSEAVQDAWLHAIPKAPGCGARISLTFREMRQAGVA